VVLYRAQHLGRLSASGLEDNLPEMVPAPPSKWNILLIEDEIEVRRQVKEYLSPEIFAARSLNIIEIPDMSQALTFIREQKADMIILDIYRGKAEPGGEQTGVQILDSIKGSGFVPVVIYTALPEGIEAHASKFVRLVGKDAGGLVRLKGEIEDLFRLRIPQLYRAIVTHIDKTMCAYMWDFVLGHWADFEPLVDKPEFLRLIVQRLALTFTRQGIEQITKEVYEVQALGEPITAETVHPAEYYIKPPIGQDPMLGDVRVRVTAGNPEYLVVLWPSCDMVSSGGRTPKTDNVLCARSILAKDIPEVTDWLGSPSENKEKVVKRILHNTREKSPERYHFLPGVWDIPDLVIDFQDLEHITLAGVRELRCLATLASPFAEAMGTRFQKYIGRIGTPDLDVAAVIQKLKG